MAGNGGLNRMVPGRGGAAISPSDTLEFNPNYRAIYCGQKGDIKVDLVNGNTVTFQNVQSGTWLPVEVTKVYETGTSATKLVGVY